MYTFLLWLHNVTRWVVLLGGVAALSTAYSGLFSKRAYSGVDKATGVFFTASFAVQVIVGLILYFIGPWGVRSLSALDSAGDNRALLIFFGVYHITMMLVALVVAQLGYSRAKRAATDRLAFRNAAIGYSVGLLLVFLAIPWGIRSLWPTVQPF